MKHIYSDILTLTKLTTKLRLLQQNKEFCYNNFSVIVFILVLVCSFSMNITEVHAQNRNSRYTINGEINPENMQKWIAVVDSNKGTARGYELIRNIFNYCVRRTFYSEAYYILHTYKMNHLRDSNYFNYNMAYLENVIASSNVEQAHIPYLEKFIKIKANTLYGYLALKRRYGYNANSRNWADAIKVIKQFYPLYPKYKESLDEIIRIISLPSQNVSINNIGTNINTPLSEWDANPTNDGQYLYFSSTNRQNGFGGTDVWRSELINGTWQKPINLGPRINNKFEETIDNITADGNGILLSGNFANTYGKFDIYFIEQENGEWGSLRHLPMPINSIYVDEGACISADGQTMIFTSDRPGGVGEFIQHGTRRNGSEMGNLDFYVCHKTPDGWSAPINIGNAINTPFAERSPYLHSDGKTLYFSSEGHSGFGSLDVFKSTRLSDTSWTQWSKPINLGKEINTISDDWGYKVSVSGDSATFSALRRTLGAGEWDIFSVSLPQIVQPEKVVTIKGKVTDTKGKPLEVNLKWEDLSNGKFMGELKSNAATGKYFIALPLGKNYGYFAEKSGYYPLSQNIDLSKAKAGKEYVVNIVMTSIEDIFEKGKEVTINNIFFDYNKSELKEESFLELNRLFEFIKNEKKSIIEIIGHTDNIGGKDFNAELSYKRAEAVAEYLISKGIDRDNLKIKGMGSDIPLAPNSSDENMAKNRRVEFKISRKI